MNRFQLEQVTLKPGDNARKPRSIISIAGKSTPVDGALLEAVVQLDASSGIPGYVLFLTDDVPYEDALSISLTDADLTILDSARLSGIYTTGTFADLVLHPPSRLTFRFFDECVWSLNLLKKPSMRLPFASDPAGVHRALGFQRRFIVGRTKIIG